MTTMMESAEQQQVMYQAFFDELESIQKEAGWQAIKNLGATAGRMVRNPVAAAKGLKTTAVKGWKGQAGRETGLAGAGSALLGTPQGRAALIGAGGLGLGGAAGAGYLAGRAR